MLKQTELLLLLSLLLFYKLLVLAATRAMSLTCRVRCGGGMRIFVGRIKCYLRVSACWIGRGYGSVEFGVCYGAREHND